MSLLFIWVSFILLLSFYENLELLHYILSSGVMLFLTYFYNRIEPFRIWPKIVVPLLGVPSGVTWYVIFVYNDFLCLNPLRYEYFVGLSFLYLYVMVYVFFESSKE